MPTYSSICNSCGTQHEYIRKIADREQTPVCCDVPTAKLMTAPQISAMSFTGHKGFHIPDGKNNGKGTWIESGTDYQKYLNKNGMMPASEGHAEARKNREYKVQENRKRIRETVEKVVRAHSD